MESIRILVLGDAGVGKSSLVHLLTIGPPTASSWSYERTIGCATAVKMHRKRDGKQVVVELVDVGGRSKHHASRSALYNKQDGLLLVFDVSVPKSLANLAHWIEEASGDCVMPMLFVGNKTDLNPNECLVQNEIAETYSSSCVLLVI